MGQGYRQLGIVSIRLSRYIKDVPFFSNKMFFLFLNFAMIQQIQAGLNLFWVVVDSITEISCTAVIYSHIIFNLLSFLISEGVIQRIIWKHLRYRKESFRSEDSFFKGLFALNTVMLSGNVKAHFSPKNGSNGYEIVFTQMITGYGVSCTNSRCGCKLILIRSSLEKGVIKGSTTGFDMEVFYYEFIREFYLEHMKAINKNDMLKLQLVNFLADGHEKGLPSAVYLLNSLKVEQMSIKMKILIKKLKMKIERKMRAGFITEDSNLNVKKIVEYYICKQELRSKVSAKTKLYKEFWKIYQTHHPMISKMLELNIRVNKDSDEVKAIWNHMIINFSMMCYKDHLIYSLFLQIARNAPFSSETLLINYFSMVSMRLNHGKTVRNVDVGLGENNILFYVSLNQADFAKIMFTSQNVEKLGYSINELAEKNITFLMTPFYYQRCQRFLLKVLSHT